MERKPGLGSIWPLGFACFHLKIESEFTSESFGTAMGSEMSLEGEGETTTHVWFAYKEGILVEKSVTKFNEGTTTTSGQTNVMVPNSNETKSVLKLIKFLKK